MPKNLYRVFGGPSPNSSRKYPPDPLYYIDIPRQIDRLIDRYASVLICARLYVCFHFTCLTDSFVLFFVRGRPLLVVYCSGDNYNP